MDAVTARLTPTIKKIVIVITTMFVAALFAGPAKGLFDYIRLGPRVFHGAPRQLVTGLAIETDPIVFLFNLLGLWFTGAMVERSLGTRRFLILFLSAGVLANVAIAATSGLWGWSQPVGCWLAVHALFVAFARIFDRQEIMVVPGLHFRARNIGIFWVVFALFMSAIRGDYPFVVGVVVSTITGFLLAGRGGLKEAYETFRARRHRQRYKVLDGGASGRAKPGRSQKYWN
jgi:membrane associated rhomboid family serine protease